MAPAGADSIQHAFILYRVGAFFIQLTTQNKTSMQMNIGICRNGVFRLAVDEVGYQDALSRDVDSRPG